MSCVGSTVLVSTFSITIAMHHRIRCTCIFTPSFEPASTDFSNDHLLCRSIIISVLGGIGHGNVISTARTAFERWYAAATPAPIGEAAVEQAKLPT
ncbi:hypothetical protein EGR_10098 [Echinococcus granulosus]|uniref:Uncharacterized protein n=1 Tax=Echinococcus granulosus TaxID=6210 RepID=W6U1Y4_ECHGR|nr:hypothetical protein EGR_10098 [Echinococcus granulosus]EUB55053.1 hypothetical protein EGR_10098 [Echinococcus granulosus]